MKFINNARDCILSEKEIQAIWYCMDEFIPVAIRVSEGYFTVLYMEQERVLKQGKEAVKYLCDMLSKNVFTLTTDDYFKYGLYRSLVVTTAGWVILFMIVMGTWLI